MKRFFATLTIMILGVTCAQAQPITVKEMRALVMAGESDAVEGAFAQHQAAFIAGDVNTRQSRTPFEVFDTTHPKVIEFTATWLGAKPASPYARTARARVLLKMGWLVRGGKLGRETYPRAFEEHYAMHRAALDLALEAYAIAPDLLAASDTVINLGNTGGDKDRVVEVLLNVMAARPNYYTIKQVFDLTNTGYGGAPAVGEYLCQELAPLVTDETFDVPRFCVMDWIANWNPYNGWPALLATLLEEGETPNADYFKYRLMMNTFPITEDAAEKIQAYMQNDWFTNVEEAKWFDLKVGMQFGFDLMEYTVLDRAKIAARASLKHDPLNPKLLDLVGRGSMKAVKTETGYTVEPRPDGIFHDEKLEHAKRRILVAPYDGDHWLALEKVVSARIRVTGRGGYDLLATDPYMINAIHYGQQAFKYLAHMTGKKAGQLINFDAAVADKWDAYGWDQARATIDRDADLLCPLIRLDRLMMRAQAQNRATRPADDPTAMAMEVYYLDAEARNACNEVLFADLDTLGFDAVDVQIETDYGSLLARLN